MNFYAIRAIYDLEMARNFETILPVGRLAVISEPFILLCLARPIASRMDDGARGDVRTVSCMRCLGNSCSPVMMQSVVSLYLYPEKFIARFMEPLAATNIALENW